MMHHFVSSILLVLLATIRTTAQTTATDIMFILDSKPVSLYASLVDVHPASNEGHGHDLVSTFLIDCPPPETPDNDACRGQSIYPAEVFHTQGSIWGGVTTAAKDDSTTSWLCNLASGVSISSTRSISMGPSCVKNIVTAGGASRVVTTYLDDCYVATHRVPLLVTAGAEKLPSAYYMTYPWATYESEQSELVSSLGCVVSSTSDSPAKTTGTTASSTTRGSGPSATGGSASTTKAPGSEAQGSGTSAASSSSSTATGEASSDLKGMPWVAVVAAVAVALCLVV